MGVIQGKWKLFSLWSTPASFLDFSKILHACKTTDMDYMDPDAGCSKNAIKFNHSLTCMPVSFSPYGQLHPLTLFRIVQTLGTSKQVTFITGFSNFVNAQVCHFHLSGLQEIITYISVSNTPVNGSLGGQLQPLTLFRNILTLDESKQVTFITATVRKLYVPCL